MRRQFSQISQRLCNKTKDPAERSIFLAFFSSFFRHFFNKNALCFLRFFLRIVLSCKDALPERKKSPTVFEVHTKGCVQLLGYSSLKQAGQLIQQLRKEQN
jgi:hypothetical protein